MPSSLLGLDDEHPVGSVVAAVLVGTAEPVDIVVEPAVPVAWELRAHAEQESEFC